MCGPERPVTVFKFFYNLPINMTSHLVSLIQNAKYSKEAVLSSFGFLHKQCVEDVMVIETS